MPKSWSRLESLDTGHPVRDSRAARRAAHRGVLPLFRRHGRQVRGLDVPPVEAGLPQLRAARAGRRRRADRAVELSADVHQLEDGAGARRRQHRRHEAGRAHAAVDAAHRRADGTRPACPTAWSTSCRATAHIAGAAPRRASRRREDRVHRQRPRPAGASCRRRAGNLKKVQLELGGKGAEHRVRRRRPRRRGQRQRRGRSSTTRARPASPARA